MEEIWKKIPGFSRYEASNTGKLRSINYKRTGKIKELKPSVSQGYYKTMLLNDLGKYKSWNVHKFVMLAFYGEPNGLEVNHKDGDKLNNQIDNLEYCTRAENIKHAVDNKLQKPRRGELNGMSKLTSEDVRFIRETARTRGRYYGRKNLALKYGVSESTIKDIVTRRRNAWPHI